MLIGEIHCLGNKKEFIFEDPLPKYHTFTFPKDSRIYRAGLTSIHWADHTSKMYDYCIVLHVWEDCGRDFRVWDEEPDYYDKATDGKGKYLIKYNSKAPCLAKVEWEDEDF